MATSYISAKDDLARRRLILANNPGMSFCLTMGVDFGNGFEGREESIIQLKASSHGLSSISHARACKVASMWRKMPKPKPVRERPYDSKPSPDLLIRKKATQNHRYPDSFDGSHPALVALDIEGPKTFDPEAWDGGTDSDEVCTDSSLSDDGMVTTY